MKTYDPANGSKMQRLLYCSFQRGAAPRRRTARPQRTAAPRRGMQFFGEVCAVLVIFGLAVLAMIVL
jgi:hypothetical protein|tara:strand:- start:2201 stop:2401 length:201 start_codon:yes stop_codon:yes gene_type:complete